MEPRPRRAALSCTVMTLALTRALHAQTPPVAPPPPPDDAPVAPPAPPSSPLDGFAHAPRSERAEINLAIDRLARGQYAYAERALRAAMTALAQSPDDATPLALLLRLAEAGQNRPLRPVAAPPTQEPVAAPPAAGALPPPPPSDAEVEANEINESLAILAQRRYALARVYLHAALQARGESAGADAPIAVLMRYAQHGESVTSTIAARPNGEALPAEADERRDRFD